MIVYLKRKYPVRLTVAVLGMLCSADGITAETRGFVINFFHVATYQHEKNCPNGVITRDDTRELALKMQGLSQAKIEQLRTNFAKSRSGRAEVSRLLKFRGRINGEPVNVNHYPESVPWHHLQTVAGPYAYGFDLDGKGPGTPDSFEDPETRQQGVDNQLFRAVGCYSAYNVSHPDRPWWAQNTGTDYAVVGKLPVWLFTITAEDLGKDGEATVSFYRGVGHLRRNALATAVANLTYTVDPDPNSYGSFRGTIKDGVFTSIPDDVSMHMVGAFPGYQQLSLSEAQLRLDLRAQSSSAGGYLGGYQDWLDYWFYIGMVGSYIDITEAYHTFKSFAEANPDPETRENTAISSTFRIDAVPAFIARQDGTLITSAP